MKKVFSSEGQKRVSYIVFGVYLLLLCWLVLFKFATSIEEIPHFRQINLIPFHYDAESPFHVREVIDNILVFVPAGVYFTAFLDKQRKGTGVFAVFLLSMIFESCQWIFSIGVSDITDVIDNTLGGLLGCLLIYFLAKIFPENKMKIVNILGIIIEVAGIALLSILLIANS